MSKQINRVQSQLKQNKNYYAQKYFIDKGSYFAPHWHDYFELEIVLSGSGEHIYNNKKYILERGSAYLMSYYDFHELRAVSDMQTLKIQFNDHILPQELAKYITFNNNRFCCDLGEMQTANAEKCFSKLEYEEKSGLIFSNLMIKNLITDIIVNIIRTSSPDGSDVVPSLLQKAVGHIHNHFRENLSLKTLADTCMVTPNYLGSNFSKLMGMSFSDYLNTVRIRHACNLLESTDLTVKEIAFSSGYNSVEHFAYTFKKKLNLTPLEFRKR